MGITGTKGAEWHLAAIAGGVSFLIAASSFALELEPRITLGITYTDNVGLVATDEQDQVIYRAEPGFSLSHETARLTLDADYQLQALRYADLGETEVYHQYNADLRSELVPDMLFLDIGGRRDQSIVDPELNIPQSNLPLSGNRQDRDEYFVSPSFQHAFSQTVTGRATYENSWVKYGETQPGLSSADSENRSAQISFDNYRRGRGLTWAARYDWQRTDYTEAFEPFEYQQAALELGVWLSGSTRIFASGGKESAWDAPLDPALEDDFWEAGIVHKVGERLSAEFAAGERSFGSSWRGNLEFTFRRGFTSLSYAETPTTESRNRSQLLAADFRDPALSDDLLSRPGTGERFVAKNLEWSLGYNLPRTSLTLAVFSRERSDRTTAEGEAVGDEDQQGMNATVTYRVGARTNLGFNGSIARREFDDGAQSDIIRAVFNIDYQLGARTTLTLEYEYAEEDPDELGPARDYVANSVSILLARTF